MLRQKLTLEEKRNCNYKTAANKTNYFRTDRILKEKTFDKHQTYHKFI